jgi:hypothetical protein
MSLQDDIKYLKHQLKTTTELLEKAEAKQAKEFAKPKSKRIVIDEGQDSYSVHAYGQPYSRRTRDAINNDNTFVDEQSAKLQSQRNTLVYNMRVAALECPVDWIDCEEKYFPSWDCKDKCIYVSFRHCNRASQLPHFLCDDKLFKFMDSLSADEQKLLICGVE